MKMDATIRAGEDNDGTMFLDGVAQAGKWFQICFACDGAPKQLAKTPHI
jgi:hypothetical protein